MDEPTETELRDSIEYWKRLHQQQVELRLQAETNWGHAAAERDRLLEQTRVLDADWAHEKVLRFAARDRDAVIIEKLEAERDALRAAVQTALGVALKHMVDCHDDDCEKCVAFGEVYPHLGPLDADGEVVDG